ncbi:uncharacterized protein LOC117908991 isoform X1 [Vitis riparia]|nr:uncharacterized protein LOC117908991 isoform X1 [Vitis riparia]
MHDSCAGGRAKMRKREKIGYEDVVAKCSNAKFDVGKIVDNVDTDVSLRRIKRIILSVKKPSYIRKLRSGKLRHEVRCRLQYLLSKLVERHNWKEASGVLGMLLKGTCKDTSPMNNRVKYWVTMELLKHIESDHINPTRIKRIYETWMRRIGSMKKWPIEDRFAVQLEYILFCLTQGNIEEAHQAAICLMQERDFGSGPILNLVVGLAFYQLWYFTIPKEMQLRDLGESCTPTESEMSATRFSNTVGNSEGYSAIDVLKEEYSSESDSETSVRNDKGNAVNANIDLHRELSEGINDNLRSEKSFPQPQDFYMNSAGNTGHEETSFPYDGDNITQLASIFSGHERWDSWLLPLRLPHSYANFEDLIHLHRELINDYYKSAVKYLKLALYSTPPILAALLPFIQLLLLGGQVKEALNELEKFSHNSNATLPIRLRASVLEHFDRENCVGLSTCFEDILKKDPTSSYSLAKLISIHQNGDYDAASLLEMIALHLDATYAEFDIWREFALCFLKISQCEEDRMSVCLDGNEGKHKPKYAVRFNRIPNIFIEGKSGKAWRFRCRWWLTRHFSKNIINSEVAAGKLELLTYKAACASHMYGQGFEYVVGAYNCLDKEKNRDMLLFLQMHMHTSTGFYSYFGERTK